MSLMTPWGVVALEQRDKLQKPHPTRPVLWLYRPDMPDLPSQTLLPLLPGLFSDTLLS